jgi:hypothetical protein
MISITGWTPCGGVSLAGLVRLPCRGALARERIVSVESLV